MPNSDEVLPFEIPATEVQDLKDSAAPFVLLDCREPAEWQIAKLDGAVEIPMGEVPQRILELEKCREDRIVVYCHHGMRSQMVTEWLRSQGFARAQNLVGGIDAWSTQVDPSVPRY